MKLVQVCKVLDAAEQISCFLISGFDALWSQHISILNLDTGGKSRASRLMRNRISQANLLAVAF
ncbi:UNVERIFIED_CONTAM: hypothetical protein NY603_28560, partial [Bacteroidetes bacterium 56_B9]